MKLIKFLGNKDNIEIIWENKKTNSKVRKKVNKVFDKLQNQVDKISQN